MKTFYSSYNLLLLRFVFLCRIELILWLLHLVFMYIYKLFEMGFFLVCLFVYWFLRFYDVFIIMLYIIQNHVQQAGGRATDGDDERAAECIVCIWEIVSILRFQNRHYIWEMTCGYPPLWAHNSTMKTTYSCLLLNKLIPNHTNCMAIWQAHTRFTLWIDR